ncbi:MAG: hypothetical protein Fur0025_07450 [Oscillatoriaceae cyanobacterium]
MTIDNSFRRLPDRLQAVISKIRQQHYAELYEPEADGTASLSEALNEVIEAFDSTKHIYCHLSYVWMALIFTILVEPTIKYYQPSSQDLLQDIINLLESWIEKSINQLNTSSEVILAKQKIEQLKKLPLSQDNPLPSIQVWLEAIDVFAQAIRVLDYEQAKPAILEILDSCLEGYAVFPGSQGRRELFDWWLLNVVPASWFWEHFKSLDDLESLPLTTEIKKHLIFVIRRVNAKITQKETRLTNQVSQTSLPQV